MLAYKLYYFQTGSGAEVSCLIFTAPGQKYEDICYAQDRWQQHKADMPSGQLPVLEVDGIKRPQLVSTSRFLAKQFHLLGKENLEKVKVDTVVDTISDVIARYVSIRQE